MTVTLEALRADFEEASAELRSHYEPGSIISSGFVYGHLRDTDCAKKAKARHEMALHVLWVAQEHGLEAAMLYKLSDGAIDPRKKDGEA